MADAPNNNRIIQFDALRIIAAFAVVMLHTCAQRFYDCYPSPEWDVRNIYDTLVRWAAPMFIMISGALFLDTKKTISIKTLYKKNIARIVLVFFAWSIIYALYRVNDGKGLLVTAGRMINGPFHFWFLKMLIGLYVAVPIFKAIVANKKLEQYFLAILIITAFIIPMFFPLIGHYSGTVKSLALKFYKGFRLDLASGYAGYFILGHYINNIELKGSTKKIIYALGILSFVVVGFGTRWLAGRTGTPSLLFYHNLSPFTLLETMAIFIFIRHTEIAPKYHKYIIKASKLSLGIYIIHPLMMFIASDLWGLDSASLNPAYFIPCFVVIIFTVSYIAIAILSRIPVLKKLVL